MVLVLSANVGYAAVTGGPDDPGYVEPGTVESPANGSTIVGVQGYHFGGEEDPKRPARLVSIGERAELEWQHNGSAEGATWFYEPDPLPNGNVLVVATKPGTTTVYEYDPDTHERVWTEEFDIEDTHDVTMLDEERLAIANMRNYNDSADRSDDRVFVYNRTSGEITWEWHFRDHYPISTDGGMDEDWTHVNDVEPVGDDQLLLSPRNFDQAVLVNMTTDEIDLRLGTDDDRATIYEQHNPDYLESANGTPTILVADSENHRVVEYELVERTGTDDAGLPTFEWDRTWEVGTDQLTWPRDADRLPNGNTLITDTMNHRVIEATPTGEIVWESYVTWGPYDADRVAHGGSSNGPTIRDQDAEGTYQLTGSAHIEPGESGNESFDRWLSRQAAGTVVDGPVETLTTHWRHLTPWIRPAWMDSWTLASALGAAMIALVWGSAELIVARKQILARLRSLGERL
ncbi:arylsulfotransferase [Halanaeroarchaeum sulfurireducens]|uniref:Arylsulfotransferase n=1 Tax=Halanaeroarchaeum sulfurireducens TaxID=1604004 RepID=A0A0F7P9P3_9EURY|nr:arylsulfotransferase [Halanaeroarchaeum sulfurireducens]ALG81898.1 arylsulfotransferase [Halanaeroarchaeum sulfurireducens]